MSVTKLATLFEKEFARKRIIHSLYRKYHISGCVEYPFRVCAVGLCISNPKILWRTYQRKNAETQRYCFKA